MVLLVIVDDLDVMGRFPGGDRGSANVSTESRTTSFRSFVRYKDGSKGA
jgi:hypothetical protein